MAASMKDFESIREKYGPTALSVVLHLIFLVLLGVFSDIIPADKKDIPRYIDIQIGSPFRENRTIPPAQEAPFIAEKIQQQQELQEQVAQQIAQAEELAKQGIMPKIPLQPEEKKLQQEMKKRQQSQQQKRSQPSEAQPQEEGKGEKNGNADKGQDSATYLEWLQLTVQETSSIPYQAREQGISGSAVLRLTFDRDGYVHDFRLVKETGNRLLDAAALRVARRLKVEPFPPMPTEFEQGKEIVTYDFPISFSP